MTDTAEVIDIKSGWYRPNQQLIGETMSLSLTPSSDDKLAVAITSPATCP